jgi:hypothetical protein
MKTGLKELPFALSQKSSPNYYPPQKKQRKSGKTTGFFFYEFSGDV